MEQANAFVRLPETFLDDDSNEILGRAQGSCMSLSRNLGRRLPLRRRTRVLVGFDPSTAPNGFAKIAPDGYVASLHVGFGLWAMQISSNMIAYAQKEPPCPFDVGTAKYAGAADFFDAVQTYHRHRSRLDDEQRQVHFELSNVLMAAVWAHEMAHVLRGHLDALRATFPRESNRLWDVPVAPLSESAAFVRCLEYDADSWAGFLMADLCARRPAYFEWLGARTPLDNVAFCIFGYAVICAYWRARNAEHQQRSPAYPDPLTRLAIFLQGLSQRGVGRWSDASFGRCIGAAMRWMGGAAHVFPPLAAIYDFVEESHNRDIRRDASDVLTDYFVVRDIINAHSIIHPGD